MPRSVMGFGTMFFGQRDYRPDGSYVTTEFISALGVPLIPVRSTRLIQTGHESWGGVMRHDVTSYRVVDSSGSICWKQVLTIYATIAAASVSLALFFKAMGTHNYPGPLYQLVGGQQTEGGAYYALEILSFMWPFILGGIRRVVAKQRAGCR